MRKVAEQDLRHNFDLAASKKRNLMEKPMQLNMIRAKVGKREVREEERILEEFKRQFMPQKDMIPAMSGELWEYDVSRDMIDVQNLFEAKKGKHYSYFQI